MRPNGYYWVCMAGDLCVAQWDGQSWYFMGETQAYETVERVISAILVPDTDQLILRSLREIFFDA